MGYRSTVIFGIPTNRIDEFKKGLAEIEESNLLEYAEVNDSHEGILIYTLDWVKWYDDFPTPNFVNGFVSDLYQNEEDAFLIEHGEDGAFPNEIGAWWDYVAKVSAIEVM